MRSASWLCSRRVSHSIPGTRRTRVEPKTIRLDQQQFQASGKAINDKMHLYGRIGQALVDAKQSNGDPFVAFESVIHWDAFTASVTEALYIGFVDIIVQ